VAEIVGDDTEAMSRNLTIVAAGWGKSIVFDVPERGGRASK